MDITDLAKPPITRSELAQRAGISRNTEWSIRRDQNRARLDTLREVALACGYDVEVTLRRAYDAAAVAAARNMVGDLDSANSYRSALICSAAARTGRP